MISKKVLLITALVGTGSIGLVTGYEATGFKFAVAANKDNYTCYNGIRLEPQEDGTYAVTSLQAYSGDEKNIEIPAEVNGVPITTIAKNAFQAVRTTAVNITLPDSVEVIGAGAFSGCSHLVSINIPEGIKEIGAEAFYNTTILAPKDIVFPDTLTSIGEKAFYNSSIVDGKTIFIPKSVTTIGQYAFYGWEEVTFNCEAESKPSGWSNSWYSSSSSYENTVNWGQTRP